MQGGRCERRAAGPLDIETVEGERGDVGRVLGLAKGFLLVEVGEDLGASAVEDPVSLLFSVDLTSERCSGVVLLEREGGEEGREERERGGKKGGKGQCT